MRAIYAIPILIVLTSSLLGCSADQPLNPSFPLALNDAKAALREMADEPVALQRPVIVLSGIYDPGLVGRAPEQAGRHGMRRERAR